jgi:hypothetical protein
LGGDIHEADRPFGVPWITERATEAVWDNLYRGLGQATRQGLKPPRIRDFHNGPRCARRRMYDIQRMTMRQEEHTEKCQEPTQTVEEMVTTATMRATDLPTAHSLYVRREDGGGDARRRLLAFAVTRCI